MTDHQDKQKEFVLETTTKAYEKASAYSNLILIGGYAGSFAIWSATRPQLSPKANIIIALLLGISLSAFVLFEVVKMIITGSHFMRSRKALVAKASSAEFSRLYQQVAVEDQKMVLWFMPFWYAILCLTLAAGIGALALLFLNYARFLLGYESWPG